jgi:hypothetical protein
LPQSRYDEKQSDKLKRDMLETFSKIETFENRIKTETNSMSKRNNDREHK